MIEVVRVPVANEPGLLAADEQAGDASARTGADYALPGVAVGTDHLVPVMLTILAAEDVPVGPSVPESNGFLPRRATDQPR